MADTEAYEETRDAPSPTRHLPPGAGAADGEGRVVPGVESDDDEAIADGEAQRPARSRGTSTSS